MEFNSLLCYYETSILQISQVNVNATEPNISLLFSVTTQSLIDLNKKNL